MFYSCENPVLRMEAVARLSWESGVFDVAPRSYAAIAFRSKGSGSLKLNGKEYVIGEEDILYLPQNIGYHAEYTDTEILVFHFITAYSEEEPEIYSPANREALYKLFLEAYTLWEKKEAGYIADLTALLYSVLGRLCKTETDARLPRNFLEAVSYINSNYKDGGLSVGDVCKHAGISETVFRQLLKVYCNKTPVEYITDLRLELARNLIAGGETIEAAAYSSGFNDSKYFARVVKKKYNCTPRSLKLYGK